MYNSWYCFIAFHVSDLNCSTPDIRYQYIGNWNRAENGRACITWKYVKTAYEDLQFPEGSKSAAGNACRNPSGKHRPYCYVKHDKWLYCDLPLCCKSI